jgi:hypothetical protein
VFRPRHIHRIAVACGVVLTLAVPGTALAHQDDGSSSQIFTDQQRALVERYANSPAYQATLREVKDAAAAQRQAQVPPAQVQPSRGLDWGDAGIGAAGMLVVTLSALGAVVAVQHHRRAAIPR